MGTLRQSTHELFPVACQADAGAVRRVLARYADGLDASPERLARAQLVATELATNLVRHAKPGGWVLARPVPPGAVELVAVDRGPGIADPDAAVDGRTPVPGGLGHGLSAVRRGAAAFDVHTEVGAGTAVLAVVDLHGDGPRPPRTWAGVSVGVTDPCGDGWAVAETSEGTAVAVVDGLGHGRRASTAADAALDAFAADPADVEGFPERANEALRATRGAAVTLCLLRPHVGELRQLAIGNVSGRLRCGGNERSLAFHNGTLGIQATPPRAKVSTYPWLPGSTLVLWTDGLTSRVDLSTDPGLLAHDPAVIAAVLHREHTRDRDDATVVVVRHPETP